MMRLWRRWVSLFVHAESGEALALFRIACGLCVLHSVVTLILSDLHVVLWADVQHGGYRTSVRLHWLMQALGGPTDGVVWALVITVLTAGACITTGLGGRLPPLVAGQCLIALLRSNPLAGGAYDTLLHNLLWLLVLSRSTATLSLDCRLRHGVWMRSVQVPTWPRYLVVFQMVVVYASTGIQKVSSHWSPVGGFSALYYTLQQPSWQRFDMSWLAFVYPLTQVGTAVTWFWEVSSPLLLVALYFRARPEGGGWLRAGFKRIDVRALFVTVGLAMHILAWLLMDLGQFTWASLAMYPCLWRPDELSCGARMCLHRLRLVRPQGAAP